MPLGRVRARERDSKENVTVATNGDIHQDSVPRDQIKEAKTKETDRDSRENAIVAMNGDIRQRIAQRREKERDHGMTERAQERDQLDQWIGISRPNGQEDLGIVSLRRKKRIWENRTIAIKG